MTREAVIHNQNGLVAMLVVCQYCGLNVDVSVNIYVDKAENVVYNKIRNGA